MRVPKLRFASGVLAAALAGALALPPSVLAGDDDAKAARKAHRSEGLVITNGTIYTMDPEKFAEQIATVTGGVGDIRDLHVGMLVGLGVGNEHCIAIPLGIDNSLLDLLGRRLVRQDGIVDESPPALGGRRRLRGG